MFKNFNGVFDDAAKEMNEGVIELSMNDFNDTLPKGIKPETVVKVADHYRQYTTETAKNFVRTAADFKPGDYSLFAETPFGNIEHALTLGETNELTLSNHIDMNEYKDTLDKLAVSVTSIDPGEEIDDDE